MNKHPLAHEEPRRGVDKSALISGISGSLGLLGLVCVIFSAIHYEDIWSLMGAKGEIEVSFIPEEKPVEKSMPEEVKKTQRPHTMPRFILAEHTYEEPMAIVPQLPEVQVHSELEEWHPEYSEDEAIAVEFIEKKPKVAPVKSQKLAQIAGHATAEIVVPDKKVRYKHAPSLPSSINSSRIGKVDALIRVVVSVDKEGLPTHVQILKATGNVELDRMFVHWVREKWSFYPAEKDGVSIASKVVVPVRLKID